MNKRGVFFSTDALVALIIILITIAIAYPIIRYSNYDTSVQSDIMNVLSTLKIGEINNSYVKTLIDNGQITDLNKSVLEQIGEFYSIDPAMARVLASSVLSSLDIKDNIGIWYGSTLIFSKNTSSYENSKNVIVERQIISGIREGGNVTGFSARSFLSGSLQSKYFYFGGYLGEGNISVNINYNGNLTGIEMEIATNKDFKIYINDVFSGQYENSSSEFSPKKYDLSAYIGNFHSGNNIIKITGDNLYIAGGFLKITYTEPGAYEEDTRYYFPGIEGVINIYDGFYVPGDLNNMNIYLHYNSNYNLFLNIGNVTVFNGSNNGETTETISNSELSALLDYDSLDMKTIPLRLGLSEFQAVRGGNADVVLITDLSGSMNYKLDADVTGVERDCDDPNLYNQDTKRISLAKCLDKMVVDTILNVQGNRIALSGFYGDNNSPFKGRVYEEGLTADADYLKGQIGLYSPQGGTPICAAINDAYRILNEQSNSSRNKFVIIMSDGIPTHTCQAASGCEGTRTGLPNEEALWLGWGAGCYGGSDDCEVNDCNCASQNANWSSCRVHNELNSTVYSIGFGPVSTCTMANSTLRNIAECGGGKYYSSDNATLLEEFYKTISEEIIELSYIEQISEIIGDFNNTRLYPDSYIEFNYTKTSIPYGLITSFEKQFYNDYYGIFNAPHDSKIVDTKVVSYSGPRWTDIVEVDNHTIYNLSNYGSEYTKLGDPYGISIPNSMVNSNNTVKVSTGLSPQNSTSGSINNKIIYRIMRNMTSYNSSIYSIAQGCAWTVEFEDSTNATLNVPQNYSGANTCYYQSDRISVYNDNDAIEMAVLNLLKLLDIDSNGKLDTKLDENNLQVSISQISGIPYSWSTEVQIRRWD